jgi:hypothetical protein
MSNENWTKQESFYTFPQGSRAYEERKSLQNLRDGGTVGKTSCTEERETQQQQQRTQERVPCSLQSLRDEGACLPSKPYLPGSAKVYLAQISRILSFGIRFGGFPGECLHATARQTDMSFPARLYAGSSRSWLCLSVTTVTGSGLALEGICGGGNFNHGQYL